MPVRLEEKEATLIAYLSGEIDHHTAKKIRDEIDIVVEKSQPSTLVLDFGEVNFMDSSGIGLVMGRFKAMQSIGGKVVVQNPSMHIKKVMRLAGLDRLAAIQDSVRISHK